VAEALSLPVDPQALAITIGGSLEGGPGEGSCQPLAAHVDI
jgi:hypothetical protein